jgi:hypothetical protein
VKAHWLVVLVQSVLFIAPVALLSGGVAEAAPPMTCYRRLSVELTPDVPNPRDDGFLSSLLGNKVDYQLIYRGQIDSDSDDILLELVGPGPEYRCRAVIQEMRRDGRVLSIRVHGMRMYP